MNIVECIVSSCNTIKDYLNEAKNILIAAGQGDYPEPSEMKATQDDIDNSVANKWVDAELLKLMTRAESPKTITVTNEQQFIDVINKVNRNNFIGTLIIQFEDGTYTFSENFKLRKVGNWEEFLLIKSKSNDPTKVTINFEGDGVMFECFDRVNIRFENLTFNGLDNTQNREFIQLHNYSIFASSGDVNNYCVVKNFKVGISSFELSRADCGNWKFIDTLYPIKNFTNSLCWALNINASTTPNDNLDSIGVTAIDGAFVDCSGSFLDGFKTGFSSDNSTVVASSSTITNFKDDAIFSTLNGVVKGQNINIDGMGRGNCGLRLISNGFMELNIVNIKNTNIGISAIDRSSARIFNASCDNIKNRAVEAFGKTFLIVDRLNATNGNADVAAYNTSTINAYGSNLNVISGNENNWTNEGIVRK